MIIINHHQSSNMITKKKKQNFISLFHFNKIWKKSQNKSILNLSKKKKKKNGEIRKGNETSSYRIILHPHQDFRWNKKGLSCSGFEGGFIVRDPWYDDNEDEASKAKRGKQRKMLNGVEQRNGLGEAWNILNNEDQAIP